MYCGKCPDESPRIHRAGGKNTIFDWWRCSPEENAVSYKRDRISEPVLVNPDLGS
jgi:hypothetical protein